MTRHQRRRVGVGAASQVAAEPAVKVEVLRTKVEITLVKVGVGAALRHTPLRTAAMVAVRLAGVCCRWRVVDPTCRLAACGRGLQAACAVSVDSSAGRCLRPPFC